MFLPHFDIKYSNSITAQITINNDDGFGEPHNLDLRNLNETIFGKIPKMYA